MDQPFVDKVSQVMSDLFLATVEALSSIGVKVRIIFGCTQIFVMVFWLYSYFCHVFWIVLLSLSRIFVLTFKNFFVGIS